jgi:hypothetical protein
MPITQAVIDECVKAAQEAQSRGITYLKPLVEIILLTAEQAGWRPIESAPKDGTDILIAVVGMNEMYVVFYDDEPQHPDYVWMTADGPGYHRDLPTHWRPLPDPPLPTAKGEA